MPTTETVDRTPLLSYLRVQQDMDLEIATILQRAAEDAEKALLNLQGSRISDSIARSQIRNAQREINYQLAQAWQKIGDVVRAQRAVVAGKAVESTFHPFNDLFSAAGLDSASLIRSMEASAIRQVENAVSRVTLTSRPLSERVYGSKVLVSGQLDRIITSAIARGVGHQELAQAVKGFIRPDVPGGVPYAANRLARTELNNAFHGTQIQTAVKSPFILAMRWHLSGSHPRPDECNDYESGGDLPDGLWTPGAVPGKPHPNCLCWLEAETPSREQFLQQYQAGEYNDFLIENDSTPVPRVQQAPVKTAKDPLARFGRIDPDKAVKEGKYIADSVGMPAKDLAASRAMSNLKHTNPFFYGGREFQINCQRVVHAFEARMRGALVRARGNPGDDFGMSSEAGSYWDAMKGLRARMEENSATIMGVIDPDVADLAMQNAGIGHKKWAHNPAEFVKKVTEDWPDGARGIISFQRNSGAGHVFNVIKTKNGLFFLDAQTTKVYTIGRVPYWKEVARMQQDALHIARTDDLDFDDDYIDTIMEEAKE